MRAMQFILAVCGLAIAGLIARVYVDSLNYASWVRSPAELSYAFIQNASSPTTAGASDYGSDYARVKYEYVVDGYRYRGNRVMRLEHVFLPREIVQILKPGKITIFYNPDDPSDSYIFLIVPKTQILLLGVAAAMSIALSLALPKLLRLFMSTKFETGY